MKPKSFLSFAKLGLIPMAALLTTTVHATPYWWDINGATTTGFAATGTWTAGSTANWSTVLAGNLATSAVTTTNSDDLNIAATGMNAGTITVSGTQSAHSINFVTASNNAFTLSGGDAINLGSVTAGSGIFVGSLTWKTEVISTAITLNSAATDISFSNGNNNTNSNINLLTIGAVTGSAATGTQTITASTSNFGGILLNGAIEDGSGGGNVALTVNSTGSSVTSLSGTNTYKGGTIVSAGALSFLNTNAKSSSGTHAFGAGTTIGLGVGGAGGFASTDIDNAFSGIMTGSLSNVTVTPTTNVGIDTTAGNLSYTVAGSPTNGLAKLGTNTLTAGSSGYTGATKIYAGTLAIDSIAAAGSNSGIGAYATTDNAGLTLAGGTLSYTGASNGTTDRSFNTTANSTINVATAGVKLTMGNYKAGSPQHIFYVTGAAGSSLELAGVTLSAYTTITTAIPMRVNELVGTNSFSATGTGGTTIGTATSTGNLSIGGVGATIDTEVNAVGTFFKLGGSTITFTGTTFTASYIQLNGSGSFAVGGSGSLGTSGSYAGNIVAGTTANAIVYSSSADQVLSGNITGTNVLNTLTKSNNNTLTLSGTNAYGGGTTISGGTLTFLKTTSKPTAGTHAFAASTTLGLGVSGVGAFTSSDIDNAFSGTMTGSLSNVTVTATTSVGIDTTKGDFTYGSSVAGSPTKGLAKLGANTLTLTGTNTYTGATNVNAGTLLIDGTNSGTGLVTVASGAAFGGIGTQGSAVTFESGAEALLTVTSTGGGANTTPMTIADVTTYNSTEVHLNLPADLPNGTYTLASSSATPVLIGSFSTPVVESGSYGTSGSGAISLSGNDLVLTVSGVTAGDNYASWAGDNSVTGGPNGDSDNDGVSNLVEYALADGGERGVLSGDAITFTKRGAPYGSDVSYAIETSTDLGITDPWATPVSGVTENATTISYTFTPGIPVKNFARLKVAETP